MAYDSKCYDLAAVFLADSPALDNEQRRAELAQHIQTAIEDWIEYEDLSKWAREATPSVPLRR